MKIVSSLFLSICNLSFAASFAILIVLVARFLLKKMPKKYSYVLWSVVLFRLLCPISFESLFSMIPSASPLPQTALSSSAPADWRIQSGIAVIDETVNPILHKTPASALQQTFSFLAVIWVVGVLLLLSYSLFSLFKLRRTLVGAVWLEDNIYLADHIATPFVIGVFRPKIYLPSSLTEQEQKYILLHERIHIRRCDPLIKIISFFALILHWFNPLVWLAFFLSCKDMEMSCDERAVAQMDERERREYSALLLTLATGRNNLAGAPLSFGESDTKSRIQNILRHKKTAMSAAVICIVFIAVLLFGLTANPIAGLGKTEISFPAYQQPEGIWGDGANLTNTPFVLSLELPDGWTVRYPDEVDTSNFLYYQQMFLGATPVYLYQGDEYKATVGFYTFEPYEGEIDQAEFYKTVYYSIRLGSLYQWGNYRPVLTGEKSETALATIYTKQEESPGASAADWPQIELPGILSYDLDLAEYVAIQFAPNAASEEEILRIAESIELTKA